MDRHTHDHVRMKQVTSSHIDSIGYDNAKQDLHVIYKNGQRYIYHGVPPGKFDQVSRHASIGSAMHGMIKGQHDHSIE